MKTTLLAVFVTLAGLAAAQTQTPPAKPQPAPLSALPLKTYSAASRLADAVGFHVDILLNLSRESLAIGRNQPSQVTGEYIEFLEVHISEGQNLSQEGIKPHIIGNLSPKIMLFLA